MRTLSAAESVKVASGGYAPVVRVSLEDVGGVFRDVDSYYGDQRFLVGVSLSEGVDDQGPTATITLRRQIFEHSLSPLMLSSGTARGYVPSATPSPPVALYRRVRVEWYIAAADELTYSPTYTEWFVGRIDTISLSGENIELSCRDANVAVLNDSFFERERLYGLTPGAYAFQRGCFIWAAGETQVVGDLAVPSTLNGYLYRATSITTGVTGATEPTWPVVVGATVVDGGVTWTCGVATATGGVSLENVLQQMLNDSPVSLTLYAPDASGFLLNPWKQEREPILEAMRKLAQLIGWDVRPRYDSGGTYRFQLYKPDRVATVPVRTFSPSSYVDVGSLSLNIEDIRNVVRVVYSDSADLGSDGKTPKRKTSTATDAASVTAYGRRYMEIAEEATSPLDTAAEASALVAAALSDLSTPYADLEVEAFFFPWAQVGDLYRFAANDVHFDSDQDLAVVNVSHEAQLGSDGEQTFRTSLQCRGKPSGGRDRWLQWDSRPGVAPSHSLEDSMGGGTLTVAGALDVVGGARLKLTEKLARNPKFDGYEIHISKTNGFTPSAATLATVSKADTVEIGNLEPGTTYYARGIPRQLNAGRIVQGQPTAQVSFSPGYAAPRLLQPGVDYGALPANGGFEAWTAGVSVPPDAWTVRSGAWGTNASRFTNPTSGFGSGGAGTFSVQFGTTACTLASQTFSTSPGDSFRLTVRSMFYWVSPTPAVNSVRVDVEWLNALGTVLSTTSQDLSTTQGQEFVTNTLELMPPTGAAYGRTVCGRFTTTAASELFVLSDVKMERLVDPGALRVGTTALATGAVTSAKLDTNIAVAGTLSAGTTVLATTAGGNVGVGTASATFKLDVIGPTGPGAGAGTLALRVPSTAQGNRPNLAFYGTFQSSADNGARRAADIVAGFNGGTWGNEYLAFHVGNGGASNDAAALTSEAMRLTGNRRLAIGTTAAVSGNTYLRTTGDIQLDASSGILANAYFDTAWKYAANGYACALTFDASGNANIYTAASNASGAGAAATMNLRVRVQQAGHFVPGADNTLTLGASGLRWSQVWAGNATIQTSDEREKADVADSDLGLAFVEALRPVRYRWKAGQNVVEERDGVSALTPVPGKRPHYGFVAQQVKQAMGGQDFAGFIFDPTEDVYGLRYAEFIAPLVKAVQELSARVRELEQQLAGTRDATE